MTEFNHFTLSERIMIESSLKNNHSFKAISREISKDCTSISKEVKRHIIIVRKGGYGRLFNDCVNRHKCILKHVCIDNDCKRNYCKLCSKCSKFCSDYLKEICPTLSHPPNVCNGCKRLNRCTLEKAIYSATTAQKDYEMRRSESRSGIAVTEDEVVRLDKFISPLIMKGQSLHHICSNNRDVIMHSEKTIYNYVDYSLFSARNIDLARKVRYRPRKKDSERFKVDKSCKIGRTYDKFLDFMKENPDTPVVQMDSVEGVKGGKVLLTIHFVSSSFMLAFIRDANTSASVIEVFENLFLKLGDAMFKKLFPVLLTDLGSEFSNPSAIEFDKEGSRRAYVFYCEPSKPYQKPEIENNHRLIRMVIPKGCSMDHYDQDDINLMMDHINSYTRKKLNDKSPHLIFSFLHGTDILGKLEANLIHPNKVTLSPKLLKK